MTLSLRLLAGFIIGCTIGGCHGTVHNMSTTQPITQCVYCTSAPTAMDLKEVQQDLEKTKYMPLYSGIEGMQKTDKTTRLWLKFAFEQEYKGVAIDELRLRID